MQQLPEVSTRTASPPAAAPPRRRFTVSPIFWPAALLLVVFWVLLSWKLDEEYRQTMRAGSANLVNLGHAFAEQTARTVDVADQTIRDLRHELTSPNPPTDLAGYLKAMGVRPIFHLVSVIGPDGILVNSSRPFSTIDLSDREHFRVHADASPPVDRAFVSRPVLGRVSGKWSLQVTRPILGPSGEFRGVIVLSLAPEYFTQFYNQIDLGTDGAIALVGRDGVVRAWGGARAGVGPIGTVIQPADALHPGRLSSDRTLTAVGPDNVERIWAFKEIPEFGLAVVVGATESHLSQGNAQRRLAMLSAGLLVTALTAALVVVAIRHARAQTRLINDLIEQRAATVRVARARALFLENVSHELRTPLHAVVGACELLQISAAAEQDRVLVEAARRGADQLHNLLGILIDASALGSRESTDQRRTVELRVFLAQLAQEARLQLPDDSPPVQVKMGAHMPSQATFDADAVRQLVQVMMTELAVAGRASEVRMAVERQVPNAMLFTIEAESLRTDIPYTPGTGPEGETSASDTPTLHDELIHHLAISAGVEIRSIERSDIRVRTAVVVACAEVA